MSMVPFLASLVMVGAGCVALAAIVVTIREQLPAVRRLLAESRALTADREFLVQITSADTPAAPCATARPRRIPVRVVRAAPVPTSRPLRAAA